MRRKKSESTRLHKISRKIFSGEATENDLKSFNRWYHSLDDRKVEIPSSSSRTKLRNRIKQGIDQELGFNQNARKSRLSLLKWAASIAILISTIYLFNYLNSDKIIPSSETLITKSTDPGQRLTLSLPDYSTVTLNSNSEITYSSDFDKTSRIIRLSGEAFFSVNKNPNIPEFIVQTGRLNTRVLGTEFNIEAVEGEDKISVTVVSGRVQVDTVSQATFNGQIPEGVILTPEKQANFNKITGNIESTIVESNSIVSWINGVLLFQEANEHEVFAELENWYGVSFEIIGSSQEIWDFDGRYDNKSLEFVLESIGYTMGFEYTIQSEKKQVIIKYRNT